MTRNESHTEPSATMSGGRPDAAERPARDCAVVADMRDPEGLSSQGPMPATRRTRPPSIRCPNGASAAELTHATALGDPQFAVPDAAFAQPRPARGNQT